MSDAADLLGDPVLGFDRSGRDVPGVVAEHLFSQREIVVARRELCDVGCSDLGIEPHEPPVGFSQCRCEVAFAQQLLGQDGSGDLACGVACLERAEELVALAVAQVLSSSPEEPARLLQRVVFVPAAAERVTLLRRRTWSMTALASLIA